MAGPLWSGKPDPVVNGNHQGWTNVEDEGVFMILEIGLREVASHYGWTNLDSQLWRELSQTQM